MATPKTQRLPLAALALLAVAGPALAAGAGGGRALSLRQVVYADAAELALRSPEGIACDPGGALVVADTGNARLLTFTWREGTLLPGKQIRLPQLQVPVRLQLDRKGNLLVLDRKTRRIVRVVEGGTFGGVVEPKGTQATVSAFRVDPAGGVVILDVVAARVLVVSEDGRVSRELPLPKGAPGIIDVAVDPAGKLYVLDAPTATVYAAEPAGSGFQPISRGLREEVSFPTYLAPDGHGRIHVVDTNGHALVTLGSDGAFVGRELGGGEGAGALRYPAQLCVTAEGDVAVADRANNRVQIFGQAR